MNQMPPTQHSQTLAIQQHHHHHHHHQQQQQQQQQQPQKQMQHHSSLPPSNSSAAGSWYGVSSGHHGPTQQQQQHQHQLMGVSSSSSSRHFPPSNAAGQPDGGYAALTSPSGGGGGGGGGRGMVQYYETGSSSSNTMQKVSPNNMAAEYNRQSMAPGHVIQNGYLSNNGGMMQKGYGQNDVMLDPSSSVAMPTHQMMSSGVGNSSSSSSSRPMPAISPNADYYQDQRMAVSGCRPMYSQQQQFDPCLPGHGSTMMEAVRTQMGPTSMGPGMGPDLSPEAMVCCDGRGALPQQRTMMMGYHHPHHQHHHQSSSSSSSQRVMPYPNPQQYMLNKRAQYSVRRKMMYDYDPGMQQYNSGYYGNSWPRQPLPQHQQQPMVSQDYPGVGLPCHIKEEPDSYLLQITGPSQNQCQPMTMWQSSREPVVMRNNAPFSPPPGNPTPPMTPGSTSMPPCNTLDASDVVRSSHGSRMFRESELYFTFPVHDGMIKAPFQLEHNAPVSCHIFNLNDQLHESLMARPDLELMLKCFHKEDRLLATNWPASVSISINEVPLMIDRGSTQTSPHHPIFLKSICKPGQNALQISVTTCCCSHLFVLQIVHRPSVRSVFQGLITKRLLPATNTIGKIKRLLSQVTMMPPSSTNEQQQQQQQQQQHMPLPLTCPLSMQRIVVPSRGRECQHIQCFDLESYLKLNCHRNHWHCPLCKKMVGLDGLEVDQFIWAILDHPSSVSSDAVLLDISANWKPLPRPGTEYGCDAGICKKFIIANTMPLPNPGNYSTAGKGGPMTSGIAVPAGSSSVSHQKEMSSIQDRHQRTTMVAAGERDAPNYLGCLSQMTNVFLGPDASPSVAPQNNSNMEQMSFPPTPMGSQISQICTPLDGQSLHPRTPSEGHATHPHTPPDGHPFTPIDSQSQLYGKTPPDSHAMGVINPHTPSSAAFDSYGSSKQGTSTTAADGHCPPVAVGLCMGSNSEGGVLECGKQDQSGAGSEGDTLEESMENSLMTEDLTKLDFKSNLSLCDDNQDMISLLPEGFDYDDLSDLTCYLGSGSTTTTKKTNPTNKSTTTKDVDDDFLSFLN